MRRGSGPRGNRLNYPPSAAFRYLATFGKRLREVAAFLAAIRLRAASRRSCAALGIAAKLVAGNRRYLWRFCHKCVWKYGSRNVDGALLNARRRRFAKRTQRYAVYLLSLRSNGGH
jgi:hypothetical protein